MLYSGNEKQVVRLLAQKTFKNTLGLNCSCSSVKLSEAADERVCNLSGPYYRRALAERTFPYVFGQRTLLSQTLAPPW